MRTQQLYRARISDLTSRQWFVTGSRLRDVEKLVPLFSVARPSESWSSPRLQKIFDNPRVKQTFIAYDNSFAGAPIGHCSYKVEDGRAFAHWLVIDPHWAGHGIASELLSRVALVARKDGHSDLYFYFGNLRDDDARFCLSSKFVPSSPAELVAYRERLEALYA